MKLGFQRLHWLQNFFVFIVLVGCLILGIYHYTHQGKGSGTVELIAAVLLILVFLLPQSSEWNYHRLSKYQLLTIGAVDVAALAFGIYHLSRPDGMRSGISELTIFAMLTLTIFLPFGLPQEQVTSKSTIVSKTRED